MALSKPLALASLCHGRGLIVPLSALPTLARAAFMAYFLVYLKVNFGLTVDQIGLFIAGFVLFSSLVSLVAGVLTDRLGPKWVMVLSPLLQSAAYVGLQLCDSLIVAFMLCLILNLAYLASETAVRLCIARWFSVHQTAGVLSVKYSLTNIAYAVGPLMGLWLHSLGGNPLLLCAVMASLLMAAAFLPWQPSDCGSDDSTPQEAMLSTLRSMVADRTLLTYTLATILLAGVFGQFHLYIGQYLLTRYSVQQMYEIINVVFITNALTSACLQYVLGRHVSVEHFARWIGLCLAAFAIGLIGFGTSSTLVGWILFTLIFTVGEIIVQPVEFLFITEIAPAHRAGAYYSSQNLTYLGAASTPLVAGLILSQVSPIWLLVYLLTLLATGGGILLRHSRKIRPTTVLVDEHGGGR
ncbi:MFS transporter [Pseudomonas aeruginosa]|uniref:MFS transporter n=1 Tax=Pseudomonas aeruginosa TaxID=287 RepID=UPI001374BD96|nr:MFS transporter [Pseudomonas aeruginosa]EIU3791052.1 MFS transporter [Pseudomonas aeruginosa]EKV0488456.1 MFS transporter [Pseudomonas aeruginosa]MBG3914874.1 MFS transporter [Pseudomonas aeruginosa]MBG4469604.1 MFS transporter [Pseudomonas aeruginosa]MBG6810811.1 MFS transporter [Pseudomonas aeruginosa]